MRMNKLTLLLVGALLCAPTFTACEDDPEPDGGVVTGSDDPSENEGGESTDWYRSWFEQPEEDQWMLRWMLGDDTTLRGPGEYEFQVPASGDEFTFWFPDCDTELEYADFDGIITRGTNVNCYENVIYTNVGENGVDIRFNQNPMETEGRYAFHYRNSKGARVSFLFIQDEASGLEHGNAGPLRWLSDDCRVFLSKSASGTVLEIYPENGRSEFSVKCLNADHLKITSVKTPGGETLPTDGTTVECGGASFSVTGDTVLFRIGENTSDSLKKFELTVASGDQSTKFVITQSYFGYMEDSWRVFLNPPELMLVNDGSRWTEPRVFKVDPEGGIYDFRILNYCAFSLYKYIINGKYCQQNWGELGGGTIVIEDGWAPATEGAITCKMPEYVLEDNGGGASNFYNNKKSEEFKIFSNYTNTERVIEVIMVYSTYSAGFCRTISIIFVQPPMGKSRKN